MADIYNKTQQNLKILLEVQCPEDQHLVTCPLDARSMTESYSLSCKNKLDANLLRFSSQV